MVHPVVSSVECMVHSYLNMAHHTIVDVNFPIGNFVLY